LEGGLWNPHIQKRNKGTKKKNYRKTEREAQKPHIGFFL